MAHVGDLLRKARIARGISLKDISQETKIGTSYLEAVENIEGIPAL